MSGYGENKMKYLLLCGFLVLAPIFTGPTAAQDAKHDAEVAHLLMQMEEIAERLRVLRLPDTPTLEARITELEMRVCGESPCIPGKPAPSGAWVLR